MGFWMQFVRPATNLPELYEPLEPDYPEFYELTWEGMFEVAAAMELVGILDTGAVPPESAEWPPAGLSQERADELWPYLFEHRGPGEAQLGDVLGPHERQAVANYLTRFEAATGHPAPPGKALAYKFLSSDGWLVTPEECLVIADALDAALDEQRDGLVRGLQERGYSHTPDSVWDLLVWWSQYNRIAADHGGYRVW